ncbi:MAG: hypothetical protein O2954_03740 [bacterium]|nr:hypothetical protein [bacterium]
MDNTDQIDFSDNPRISPKSVLRLLEDFLPFAVKIFRERKDLFDLPPYEPGLRESNLAVVLAEIATSENYSESEYSREELLAVIHEALERTASNPWDQVSPLAWGYVAYAAALLGDRLERPLYEDIRTKVARWADHLLDYDFPTGLYRDTKAEETCWTVGPLVGAQVLNPGDPRCEAWQEKANRFFLNSYNREEDLWEKEVIEGLPVHDRVTTANVFPDFTTENHGAFHPTYQTCFNNYAIPYILYKKFLGHVPQTLTWNWKGLHTVMARLFAADGRIFYTTGNDYYPYSHGEQAHYLAIVTDALKDPLALWALKKALQNIHDLQRAHGGRMVDTYINGDQHLYWEFHFASFIAFAHALAPYEGTHLYNDQQALAHAGGPWVSPYAGILVHKGRKLHSGFGLKALVNRHPGTGFIVPQGTRVWTDYFCALPQLAPTIRNAAGEAVNLELKNHIIDTNTSEAWVLGAWMDQELRIRRTMAFLAHEEGVLHIDRIMRYGEQVPIFGTDMQLSRTKAEGPEFHPWSVETLNYRLANESLYFRSIHVQHEGGEHVVENEAAQWTAPGDWIFLDGRLGLIRLWGNEDWHFDYRMETTPLREKHFWKHETWALNITFRNSSPPPRGYGLMGGHAVLFVPANNAETVAEIAQDQRAQIVEQHGDFGFASSLDGWHASHLIRLGHLLGFS